MSLSLASCIEDFSSFIQKMSRRRRIFHSVMLIAFGGGQLIFGLPLHICVLTMVIVLLTLWGVDCCISSCRMLDAHSTAMESLDETREFASTPDQVSEARRIIAEVQSDPDLPWLASFLKHIADQARMTTQVSVPHAIEHLKSEISRSVSMLVMNFVLSALLITGVASTIYSMQNSLPKLINAIEKITKRVESADSAPKSSLEVRKEHEARVDRYGADSGEFFKGVKTAYLPSLWAIIGTIILLVGRSWIHRNECAFLAQLETAGRRVVEFYWQRPEHHPSDKLAVSVDRMAEVFSVKGGGMDHALDVFTTHSKQLRQSITLASVANRKIPQAIDAAAVRADSFIEKLDGSRTELANTVTSAATKVEAWASRSETIATASRDVLVESKVVMQQVATTVDKTATSINEQTAAFRATSEAVTNVLIQARESVLESAAQLGKRFDSFEQGLMGLVTKMDSNQNDLASRLAKLEVSITSLAQTVAKTMQDSTQVHRELIESSRELKTLTVQGMNIGQSVSQTSSALTQVVQTLSGGIGAQLPPLTKAIESATTVSNQSLQAAQASLSTAGSILTSAEQSMRVLSTASADLRVTLDSASANLSTTNDRLTGALPQLVSILDKAQLAASETSRAGAEITRSLAVLPTTIATNAADVADNAARTLTSLHNQINLTVETSLQRLESGITAIAKLARRTRTSSASTGGSPGPSQGPATSWGQRILHALKLRK